MRKIILYSMFLFAIVYRSSAQTKEENIVKEPRSQQKKIKKETVPKEVSEAFVLIYPNEPVIQWYAYPYYWDFEVGELAVDSSGYIIEYEFPEFYEVEMLKENKKQRSLFSRAGKLIHTRHEVSKGELPKVVQDEFNRSPYKNWNIVGEQELIQFTEPNIRVYSIHVKKGRQKHVLYYAENNGQLIQVKKIKN